MEPRMNTDEDKPKSMALINRSGESFREEESQSLAAYFAIEEYFRNIVALLIFSNSGSSCCSPRLQTREFSSQLATKPSPLKRRATASVHPGEQNARFHLRCQQNQVLSLRF